MNTPWFLAACLAACGLVAASPATADTASADANELEEVLVTAQKRSEDLQLVPLSVETVSDEELANLTASGDDVRLLSGRVPSLLVESSYGRTFPRFYIRGLGNTDFDFNASQPVSLVYDEVVLENPILKGYPIYDLDRIEVLRGPQGTLFGRNTPAGIVKFESRKPTWDTEAFTRASFGLYQNVQYEGAVGGPIVEDKLAGRISFLYQGRDDWVDNTFTAEEDVLGGYAEAAGRVQLLYRQPGEQFTALFNAHFRELDGTARLFRANLIQPGTNELVDDFEREEVAIDGRNRQEVHEAGGVATLTYDAGEVTVTSVSGYETADMYSRGDVDGGYGAAFADSMGPGVIPFPSETADGVPSLNQFTQELRVASNGWEMVNFQAGFFYFYEDLEIESFSYNTLGGGFLDGYARQTQETTSWAAFGTAEVAATEQLTLSAGARFSRDEKDFTAERTMSSIGGGALAPITVSPEDDMVGWDASARFAVNRDVNVYGRVAQSFRAPSSQGRVLFGDAVSVADTETILSYEVGVKTRYLDGRARTNVSAFVYEMDDQQLTAVGGTQNFNTLLNADKTKGFGFEVDAAFLAAARTLVTAGASLNDTEIDDPNLGVVPGAAAGLTVLDPAVPGNPGVVSLDGNMLPNAPKWVFNATARHGLPVTSKTEMFLFTDWAFRSEVSFFLYDSEEFTSEPWFEGGLRVGYAHIDGDYEVAAFVRNLTDEEAIVGAIDFNNLTGMMNEPRTFGLEMRRNF